MGKKASEALTISQDELKNYLHAHHSAYIQTADKLYYITDVNDSYWRAQDTDKLNEKGHYVDASDLVSTLAEFLDLPFIQGKSINEEFDNLTFFASEK